MNAGWRERFFACLEKDPHQGRCAELAGVSPQHICRLKRRDPEFRNEMEKRLDVYRSKSLDRTLARQRRSQLREA